MKFIFTIFLILPMFISKITAQETKPDKWIYGVQSGTIFSKVLYTGNSASGGAELDYKTDFNLGFTAEYFLNPFKQNISIETGLFYSRKGVFQGDIQTTNSEGEITGIIKDSQYNYNYLLIPVNIKYYLHLNLKNSIFLSAGGIFAPLLHTSFYIHL